MSIKDTGEFYHVFEHILRDMVELEHRDYRTKEKRYGRQALNKRDFVKQVYLNPEVR